SINAMPNIKDAKLILFHSYLGEGKTEKALKIIDYIDIDNQNILINFSFISEREKEIYFKTIRPDYMRFNSFALLNKEKYPELTEKVTDNTIRNKGLLLKSNTAMQNAVMKSGDEKLIKTYSQWKDMKINISKLYSRGENTRELEEQADSLERYLVSNSTLFSDFEKIRKITWKDVQKNLKPDEAAIEFLNFDLYNPDSNLYDFTEYVQYVALIITPDCSYPLMIPLFLENELEQFLKSPVEQSNKTISRLYGTRKVTNKKLYELIWEPVEKYLGNAKTIYISPAGLLHKISFPAISGNKGLLCDNYDLRLYSSICETSFLKPVEFGSEKTASIFGGIDYQVDSTAIVVWNYLEGTKTESEKIDKLLHAGGLDVKYFSSKSATEDEFKHIASQSNIMHISTHGFFFTGDVSSTNVQENNEELGDVVFRGTESGFGNKLFVETNNPLMRSGLVFAGANRVWNKDVPENEDDGVLTAQEVAHIDMRKTDLVVLSACETGLGDIQGIEGVYGLQRAFKMAGVKYIIMSLWQVPDKETVEFMEIFYNKLIKTKDVHEAYINTQREMRKKYDPYYWAAFVLIE
ncbi:MAG: CHAT domain-containing protein, partial [Bacteroidota bacterium]